MVKTDLTDKSISIKSTRSLLSSLLVLHHLHHPATTSGGLGVLTTNLESPEVTETTVVAAPFHALKIFTESPHQVVGESVAGLAGLEFTLSVQEPSRDLKLKRVGQDGDDLIDLIDGHFTSTLVQIDIALLADQVPHALANSGDGAQS